MLDRISKLIKSMKISSSQFADEIGVQRSSVSHVLSGRNKPSLDFVTKILAAYPDINSEWLLSGKGNMILDADTERRDDEVTGEGQTSLEIEEFVSEKEEKKEFLAKESKKKAGNIKNVAGHKSIERIVLFHRDGTFSEFTPGDA